MIQARRIRWPWSLPSGGVRGLNSKKKMGVSILIVDDEPNVRLMYRTALAGYGYDVVEANSAEAALEEFQKRGFDAAILDMRMPGMNGLELLAKMHQLGIATPAAFITAHGDVPNAVRAMELGAIDFLPKPPTPDQLRDVVKDILLRHSAPLNVMAIRDFDYYLRSAKRAINLRDFAKANKHLIKALDINAGSKQAINLVGVMLEMREEHERLLTKDPGKPAEGARKS
jgi:FixJ family two-component response regulator